MLPVEKDGTHGLAVDHGTTHEALLHHLANIENAPVVIHTVARHNGEEADVREVGAAVQKEGMVGEGGPGLGPGLVIVGGPGPGPGLVIVGGPGPGPVLVIVGGPDPDPGLMIVGGPGLDPGPVVAGGPGLVVARGLGPMIEGSQDHLQDPDIVAVVPGLVLVLEVMGVTNVHAQDRILVTGEEGVGDHHRGTGGEAIVPVHIPGIATDCPHFLIVPVTG